MKQTESKKVRVLYITYEYGDRVAGGIGRVINSLTSHMRSRAEVSVFLLHYNRFFSHWSSTRYKLEDKGQKKRTSWRFYLITLTSLLKKKSYDLVHILHPGHETVECIRMIKEHFPALPVVYSVHSLMRHEMNIRHNEKRMLGYEEYIMDHLDHIHVLNGFSKKCLDRCYPGVSGTKGCSVIPNGIDETEYQTINEELLHDFTGKIEKGVILLACITRWSYGKGLEYLLDALPYVLEKNDKIRLVLAGRKPGSWENKVDEYIAKIDKKLEEAAEYVHPMGWLDDRGRNTLLSLADITIMPSELEYFPYSILEPMICGNPIISSSIECVTELLEEHTECLFYPPRDPRLLAEKIIELAESKEKREKMAHKVYKKASTIYRWDNITNQYYTMYRDIISSHP